MPGTNYIYRMGTAPNTRAAVSQKNKIFGYTVGQTGFQQLGAISEFSFDESRAIDPVRGVGFGDIIAELVPGVTEPMTLTLNKTLLYTQNLFQLVGYKGGVDGVIRSLRHHRWPFDIKQELVFSEVASAEAISNQASPGIVTAQSNEQYQNMPGAHYVGTIGALLTFFEGCWFNSYNASYTSDAAIVAESSSVTVTDVLGSQTSSESYGEFIDSGLVPTAPGTTGSLRFADANNIQP
jgi:hypothetical protein